MVLGHTHQVVKFTIVETPMAQFDIHPHLTNFIFGVVLAVLGCSWFANCMFAMSSVSLIEKHRAHRYFSIGNLGVGVRRCTCVKLCLDNKTNGGLHVWAALSPRCFLSAMFLGEPVRPRRTSLCSAVVTDIQAIATSNVVCMFNGNRCG